jgi:hypothetical protein
MKRTLVLSLLSACSASLGVAPNPPGTTTSTKPPVTTTTNTTPPSQPYAPTEGITGAVHVEFHLPRGQTQDFYQLPWPTDIMKTPQGLLDLSNFPQNTRLLVSAYVAEAERSLSGYSTSPSVYFHFSGAMPAALPPTPGDTMSFNAPLFLLDVDPNSPERGSFVPVELRAYRQDYLYVPQNTLAVKSIAGWALRPSTLYAAVIRRELADGNGLALGTTFDLEVTKWTEARSSSDEESARELHQPVYDYLESQGVARDDVAGIAVFRTQAPADVTSAMFSVVTHLSGAYTPKILSAKWNDTLVYSGAPYNVIEGHYCTPNFQTQIDMAPFGTGGGTIAFDAGGNPLVSDIPPSSAYYHTECAPLMEAHYVSGPFPLMESAHGTGGDATSFIANQANDFGAWAASNGIAGVSTEQPLAYPAGAPTDPGARPGASGAVVLAIGGITVPLPSGLNLTPQELFYNPVNPGAGRDNARQASTDAVVLARLAAATDWSQVSGLDSTHPIPTFDATRFVASGHSQGSQTNAPYAAIDPLVKGVLLSGCGGDIRIGILERTSPFALAPLIVAVAGTYDGELDEFHPLMALAQSIADPVDPQNYARLYRDPLPGHTAQNVMHFVGTNDTENPPASGEAMAVALRAVEIAPVLDPVLGLTLAGIAPSNGAVSGNNRGATAVFAEFYNPTEDGHFIMYDVPAARALAAQFFATVLPGPLTMGP